MSNTLEITNLTKKYFNKVALENVSLNISKGKIYGLLGPNGSGKTTLMKLVAGLHKQTSGNILINGNPVSYKTKGDVVFMPTENYLYQGMKVKNTLKYFDDMYKDFDISKSIKLLEELDVDLGVKVSELSTGLRSRLKLALAFSRKAHLYLIDEPLNGIDPISREKILNLITESLNNESAILVSSHIVNELEKVLDDVIFVKNGYIELIGSAETLRIENEKSIEDLYKEVFSYA